MPWVIVNKSTGDIRSWVRYLPGPPLDPTTELEVEVDDDADIKTTKKWTPGGFRPFTVAEAQARDGALPDAARASQLAQLNAAQTIPELKAALRVLLGLG